MQVFDNLHVRHRHRRPTAAAPSYTEQETVAHPPQRVDPEDFFRLQKLDEIRYRGGSGRGRRPQATTTTEAPPSEFPSSSEHPMVHWRRHYGGGPQHRRCAQEKAISVARTKEFAMCPCFRDLAMCHKKVFFKKKTIKKRQFWQFLSNVACRK